MPDTSQESQPLCYVTTVGANVMPRHGGVNAKKSLNTMQLGEEVSGGAGLRSFNDDRPFYFQSEVIFRCTVLFLRGFCLTNFNLMD